jgi:hypothetical protein
MMFRQRMSMSIESTTLGRTVVLAILFSVSAGANPLSAATITFDNLDLTFGVHEIVEDGMRYRTTGGFEVRPAFSRFGLLGNPPSGLIGTPLNNQPFIITRDDGGVFIFDRYDSASLAPGQQSDTWEFRGLLDGVQQFAFLDDTSTAFVTRLTGLAKPIDHLELSVSSESMAAAVADNFVFTLLVVPEPPSVALFASGLGLLIWLSSNRWSKVLKCCLA